MATYYEMDGDSLTCSVGEAARELGYSSETLRRAICADIAAGRVSRFGSVITDDSDSLAFPLPWTRIGQRYRIPRHAIASALGKDQS